MGFDVELSSSKRPYDNSHYHCEICFKEIKEDECIYIEIDWVEDNISTGTIAYCHKKCFFDEVKSLSEAKKK